MNDTDHLPADNFLGSWLVSEHVFDPDGTFVGIVRQHRRLHSLESGGIRVTQVCHPEARLSGHPMAAFEGEWIFDLVADGSTRRYLGPDVVGSGTEWSPGVMTGQGLWPRFGHTFESYAVMVSDDRQLTGGFFSRVGRSVADIVGVAVPEPADGSTPWPELDLTAAPPAVEISGPSLTRRVGPLLVAESWPDPTTRVRTLAMSDGPTDLTIATVSDTASGRAHQVEATVTKTGST